MRVTSVREISTGNFESKLARSYSAASSATVRTLVVQRVSHRDVSVVHVPYGAGDFAHDICCLLLALEMVRRQQVASLTQFLMTFDYIELA